MWYIKILLIILRNGIFCHIGNKHHFVMLTNDWAQIFNKGEKIDRFILDFEKAFSTPHCKPPSHEIVHCVPISSMHLFGVCQCTRFNIRCLLFFRSVEKTTSKLDVQSVFPKTDKPAGIKSTSGPTSCLDISPNMVSLEKK